jgi:hypothetical protein
VILARVELDAAPFEVGVDPKGFVVLEKLDADGNPLWSDRLGDATDYVEAAWVTTDRDDNVVLLAGGLGEAFDFGGGKLSGIGVLAKYDADGRYLFSKTLGDAGPSGFQSTNPVLVDTAGNIVVRAESFGDIDLGLGTIFCSRYLLKFDPTGEPLWNLCVDADNLAIQPDGGFVAASTLQRDKTVGEVDCVVLEQDRSGSEGLLARYDASGEWIATKCARDPSWQYFGGVTPDPSGMFFMSSAFMSQLTLPDDGVVPAIDDYYTALIAKVNVTN